MRVGIFDSGVGGLTVLKEIYDKYPDNEYVYIGDNKNSPYGEKTKEELYSYASRIIDYFIKRDIKHIVIACNTICSNVFSLLKEKYNDIVLIGVVDSTVSSFIKTNKKKVLILATTKTIESNIYENKIKEIDKNIKVYSLAAQKLVPLIENGVSVKNVLAEYLNPYKDIDSIILGCTHYKIIEKEIDKDVVIINSSDGVVVEISRYLDNCNKSSVEIYTTGDVLQFNKLCMKIMSKEGRFIDL